MSTLATNFTVSSAAYSNTVYPINAKNPTKVITENLPETETMNTTTVTVQNATDFVESPPVTTEDKTTTKTNATNTATVVCLSIMCVLSAVGLMVSVIMCRKEETALERNQNA